MERSKWYCEIILTPTIV